jgi:hypothetical protein
MSLLKKLRVWPLTALVLVSGHVFAQTAQQGPAAPGETARTDPAATQGKATPSEVAWFVTIEVKRFTESTFGQRLLGVLEQAVREETKDFNAFLDLKTARTKVGQVIGFDPLEGIVSLKIYGTASPFSGPIRTEEEIVEKMATTGVAVVTLSGGTGNLEGLALATPEYQSTKYKEATIHSGKLPDFPPRVFMAVCRQGTGKPSMVVFGLDEDQVKQALDRLTDNAVAGPEGSPAMFAPAPKGTLFSAGLKLDEKTLQVLGVPPQQSAVFKMLERVALSLATEGDSVSLQVTADVVNEERAEQVRQLVEGLVAFVQLPIGELEKEEEFLLLREIFKDVKVSRTGTRVLCSLTKQADAVFKDLIGRWIAEKEVTRQQAITAERARAAATRAQLEEVEAATRRKAPAGRPYGDAKKDPGGQPLNQ